MGPADTEMKVFAGVFGRELGDPGLVIPSLIGVAPVISSNVQTRMKTALRQEKESGKRREKTSIPVLNFTGKSFDLHKY